MGRSWCCVLLLWVVLSSKSIDTTPVHNVSPPYMPQPSGLEKQEVTPGAHNRQGAYHPNQPSEMTTSNKQEEVSGSNTKRGGHVSGQEAIPGAHTRHGGYHPKQPSEMKIASIRQEEVSGGHDKRGSHERFGTTHTSQSFKLKKTCTSNRPEVVSGDHNAPREFHTSGPTEKPQPFRVDTASVIRKEDVMPGDKNIEGGYDIVTPVYGVPHTPPVEVYPFGGSIDAPLLQPMVPSQHCKPGFKVVHGLCREIIE